MNSKIKGPLPSWSCFIIEKQQEKKQENPYLTLNYQENSCFPGFIPGVFSYDFRIGHTTHPSAFYP